MLRIVVVQLLSHIQLFETPWTIACQAPLSSISWSLLKFISIGSVMLSNHLILCCPLLLLPSIFPIIRVFSNELALPIRWSNYWSFSFSFSNSPSNEYSGLIDFLYDWLVGSPCSPRDSQESPAPQFEKNKFFNAQPSFWSISHICTWLPEKPPLWLYGPLSAKWGLCFLTHCLGLS